MKLLKVEYHRPNIAYRQGHRFDQHDFHELLVIRSGAYHADFGTGLEQNLTASVGEAVLWPAGTKHSLAEQAIPAQTTWHYFSWSGGRLPAVVGAIADPDRRLLTMATWLYELDQPGDGAQRQNLFKVLLQEIDRRLAAEPDVNAEMLRAKRYLHDHYGTHTAVSDCAAFMGMSTRQFDRLFKQTFAMTPQTYSNQCRLERALNLLQSGQGAIKDMARQAGFTSSSAFCSFIRKHTGTTPNMIRRAASVNTSA